MSYDKGAITGHFIAHWGVPTDIRPSQVNPFGDFAILEFAPRGARTSWRYATNGMCSKPQLTDEQRSVRTEIYACSEHRILWCDELLVAIATYPFLYGTYLSEFDTIDAQRPVDQGTSPYTGILLAPPGPSDRDTLGVTIVPQFEIIIHQIVGLFPEELEFAAQGGSGELWKRLRMNGEPTIDGLRSKVA
jgi:hypothetical protein